jgi:hypothetical protein
MGNLIADLKLFVSNGGNHLILKHDFHWGDDFLEGYMVVDREDIGPIIEFFASRDDDRIDSDVFEYKYDSIDLGKIRSSLSIHSAAAKDVSDMERIFGDRLGNCYWLDRIADCKANDQLTVSEDTYTTTLTPEILDKYYPEYFPFASIEAVKRVCEETSYRDFSGLAEISDDAARLLVGSDDLDLTGLKNLSTGAAESLAQHKGSLYLGALTEISDEVAQALSKHQGSLGLSGLKTLSPHAAEFLAQHKGSLYLCGLTEISDEVAQALSKHHGTLTLTGLTSLSDTAAEALSKHEGEVELPGFDDEEAAEDSDEEE